MEEIEEEQEVGVGWKRRWRRRRKWWRRDGGEGEGGSGEGWTRRWRRTTKRWEWIEVEKEEVEEGWSRSWRWGRDGGGERGDGRGMEEELEVGEG